ncbi:hypothetical protein Q3G72_014776 [Acer saccharum]|nr:hypothetical protein Q3G72_014776 [Acer saccharum]
MVKCAPYLSLKPSPIWFTLKGIPLRFWNTEFFKRLGSNMGEILLVDKQTILSNRLDRVRMLVCMPDGNLSLESIVVKEGNRDWQDRSYRRQERKTKVFPLLTITKTTLERT